MPRGMFAILSFLIFSIAVVNLYAIYQEFLKSYLNATSVLLDGEEAFYRARNFETSFFFAVSKGYISEWYSYWKPIYGYYDGKCIQVDESFGSFLKKVLKFYGNKAYLEAYGDKRSCMFLPISYKGFKTYGVLISPICINMSSPLSPC